MADILQFVDYISKKYKNELKRRIRKDSTKDKFENEFQILIKDKVAAITEHCEITKLFLTLLGFNLCTTTLILTQYRLGHKNVAWDMIFNYFNNGKDYLFIITLFYLTFDDNTIAKSPSEISEYVSLYEDKTIDIPRSYEEYWSKKDNVFDTIDKPLNPFCHMYI